MTEHEDTVPLPLAALRDALGLPEQPEDTQAMRPRPAWVWPDEDGGES